MQISTIGIDLAKRVFQIHGVDRDGNIVLRRQLRRAQVLSFFAKLPPCLVGMEACGTSHYWARELTALGHGWKRRFQPADAAAIREDPMRRLMPTGASAACGRGTDLPGDSHAERSGPTRGLHHHLR
jgi:transposase